MPIRVVKMGYVKLERFLPKNQHTQRNILNFENWTIGELAKIRVFKVHSSIIFGAKIRISGTKGVEKTLINIYFFYFWFKNKRV